MWDLPEPGIKHMSPALAGICSTTEPPGKPQKSIFTARLESQDLRQQTNFLLSLEYQRPNLQDSGYTISP